MKCRNCESETFQCSACGSLVEPWDAAVPQPAHEPQPGHEPTATTAQALIQHQWHRSPRADCEWCPEPAAVAHAVDRDALERALLEVSLVDKPPAQIARDLADAVLAVLAGEQEQVER